MSERIQKKSPIDIIDEREKKLGELTVKYLRGELSLEDYHQGCRENENRIDFRRIATWQTRMARVRKIEDQKRKITNFARKVFKLPLNS